MFSKGPYIFIEKKKTPIDFLVFDNIPANFVHLEIKMTLWMCQKEANVDLMAALKW